MDDFSGLKITGVSKRFGQFQALDGGGQKLVHFVGENGTTYEVGLWNLRVQGMATALQSEARLS